MHKAVTMTQTKWLTVTEVAETLGYDRSSITKLANKGIIRGQKVDQGRTSPWIFTPKAVADAKKRLGRAA